ncbi:MAG: hypothetical protein ACR2JY_13525 [Chloroflexota bacterium]
MPEAQTGHGHGMAAQHVAFAASIRQGTQPFADGATGRAAVAAEESIRSGGVVNVAPAPTDNHPVQRG